MTLKDTFDNAVKVISDNFGFTVDYIEDTTVDFIYAEEMNMARLVLIEPANMIAIAFHVDTPKPDAMQILEMAKNVVERIGVAEDYYIDANNGLFTGADAYAQMYNDIANDAQNMVGEKEYTPLVPITYQSPYALYEATHPEALKDKNRTKERLKYFKKF